ncbi:MAG: universal stress protein [Thermodesulfobacteriota bacterium]|nr:MAG: universal stress protein [Thermodesulfobacteriota bacterium]
MAESKRIEKFFKSILFPIDFSETSERAAPYAVSLARRYNAKLYVLHVVDVTDAAAGYYVSPISSEELEKEEAKGDKEMLRRFCARVCCGCEDEDMEAMVLSGVPHEVILKVVKEKDIDLIVMGASFPGGVDRLFFGSTAEKVMKGSSVPLFIIPPSK